MKVVIAAGLYPPDIGGPATYVRMLEDELPQHAIDVSAVPFTWVRQYPKLIRHVVYAWKLWRATTKTDVLYAMDAASVGAPAAIVAKLRRLPLVVRLGGDYAWEQGRLRFGIRQTLDDFTASRTTQPLPVRALSWLQSRVVKSARHVVVPSHYLQNIVTQWNVVSPKRITVIYSTLTPLQPTIDQSQLRSQLDLPSPVLVTAGRLVPWKGVDALINVVQDLQANYPSVTLVVAGDGPERPVLEAKVAKYGLQTSVRFVGQQDKTALANLKQAADLFVLNTAYEGLSHELLEVMDLGVPIVTTDVGGNPELLTDKIDALLVPFNNQRAMYLACRHLIEDRAYAQQLAQHAKAKTAQFSRHKAVAQIAGLLQTYHYEKT